MTGMRTTLLTMIVLSLLIAAYWMAYKSSLRMAASLSIDLERRTKTLHLEPRFTLCELTPLQWSPAVSVLFEPARRIDTLVRPDVWSKPAQEALTPEEFDRYSAD